MFEKLTKRFEDLSGRMKVGRSLTKEDLEKVSEEVRIALLDADVNYGVATRFVKKMKERAIGSELLKSLDPSEQFIKVVHEELVELMGKEEAKLSFSGSPTVFMLCGLQGAGKTTQCAKLAAFLQTKEYGKKVLLVAADLQRPAAVLQLQKLGKEVGVTVFAIEGQADPLFVASEALAVAKKGFYDLMIVDTAGRLHVNSSLMDELAALKKLLNPTEVLFVASALTGQDAVKTAKEFNDKVGITGSILTMLDADCRAGSALSILEVTGKPIKFEGFGEKMADLRPFVAESMADRVLGMGDVINLVRKVEQAQEGMDEKSMEKKLKKGSFSYEDFISQMGAIKKMGPMKGLLKMMPKSVVGDLAQDLDAPDAEFKKFEAIILSMTREERLEKVELSASRKTRIAKGSGNSIEEVNRLVKRFKELKQLLKNLAGMKGFAKQMPKNILFGGGF